tara:strand:+ start:4434 stop:5930 length:1497 start_codon:yes stop_codon:yes gene_type:complete
MKKHIGKFFFLLISVCCILFILSENKQITFDNRKNSESLAEEVDSTSLISPPIKNILDIIHNAIDKKVSYNKMYNTDLIDSTKIDIGTHILSNASFDLFNDKISVLDSIYSYDAIKYIDNYLCVYSKQNFLYMISHLGDKTKLTNFKIETIDGLNNSKEFDNKETLLYNEYYEFAFVEGGVRMNYAEYSLRKFNDKRDQAIQETIHQFGGKYVGRSVVKKRTARQVWSERLSMEQNIKLYGMNAWTTDEEYKYIPSHNIFMKNAYNYGKSVWNIYAIDEMQQDSIKQYEDSIKQYEDSITRTKEITDSRLRHSKYMQLIEADLDKYIRQNPQIKDNAKELILESIDNGIIQIESIKDILSKNKKISKRDIKKLIKDNKGNNIRLENDPNEEDSIYNIVEKSAVFPGGDLGLMKFIQRNVRYPKIAKENNITGKVYVAYTINKQGDVTNVKVVKGVNKYLDEEARRVIKSLPKYKPAMNFGKPVNSTYTIPINFSLTHN